METLPSEVQSDVTPAEAPPQAPRGTGAQGEWREAAAASGPGIPVPVRLSLQHRAPENLRRHVQRALTRFTVLVLADLATFGAMREVLRGVRDTAVLGDGVASLMQAVIPGGHLNGWQYAVALFVGMLVTGCYGTGDRRRDPARLFVGVALATALTLWSGLFSRGLEPVLVQYALTAALVWPVVVAERFAVNAVVDLVRGRAEGGVGVLFVGRAEECRRAAASAAFGPGTEFRRAGFVDVADPPGPGALGRLTDFPALLAVSGADAVVVCGALEGAAFLEVVDAARLAGSQLLALPREWSLAGLQPSVLWKDGHLLIELTRPVVRAPELLVKRVTDLTLSLIGLALLSPLFGLIATAIKADSRGPVLFGSPRWGRGGRRIRIWKFRTMVDGAAGLLDADSELRTAYAREVKLRSDPRVTRVGRLLRRWSIDELPQLFNVFWGEMSLVGPRPKLIGEETRYTGVFDIVLSVPPGVTGLWQVSGRNALSYEQRVALDVEYVRKCSIWLDLKILLQTVPVVLRGEGAH